jgi:hypothetical protein
MKLDIKIAQIYFKNKHIQFLDPDFVPFDNSQRYSELLEFDVFDRIAISEKYNLNYLWGAVSWRFGEKTGLKGRELLNYISQNNEVDIFYLNPYPVIEALYQSPWWQGEICHPNFIEIATPFLVASGFSSKYCDKVVSSEDFSMCNYFIGNKKFWNLYIPFVKKLLHNADLKMPLSLNNRLHSFDSDRNRAHNFSTYVPFIIERLFEIFKKTDGKDLIYHKINLPEAEKKLNIELKSLREMKDIAIITRSKSIFNLWKIRRSEYFLKNFQKKWCDEFLNKLNSSEPKW